MLTRAPPRGRAQNTGARGAPGPRAWIVWAVVVWNVVFDRVIVVAGRSTSRRLSCCGGDPPARPLPGRRDEPAAPAVSGWPPLPQAQSGDWLVSVRAGAPKN